MLLSRQHDCKASRRNICIISSRCSSSTSVMWKRQEHSFSTGARVSHPGTVNQKEKPGTQNSAFPNPFCHYSVDLMPYPNFRAGAFGMHPMAPIRLLSQARSSREMMHTDTGGREKGTEERAKEGAKCTTATRTLVTGGIVASITTSIDPVQPETQLLGVILANFARTIPRSTSEWPYTVVP